MRYLWWICWYLWEGWPTIFAFPIDSDEHAGTGESSSSYWELKWPRYAIGTLGLAVVGLTLAGCLCCRQKRRPKGFQDDAGNGKEFKDGSTAGTETTIERVPSASLELEVSRIATSHSASSKVQFEALPIERLVGDSRASGKPKPPSPSLFSEELETEKRNLLREQPCREWFSATNAHVPRERLKYLREIGRGWFGKVVEGTAEISEKSGMKNRGVVVRILTEEATTREKAWFLGEATPYLKLAHPNILTLLGSCLETDPYLLLFEACPAGDLKGFLRGNRDKGTCETLRKENVPARLAIDIANALEHMHENGFAHTDLSARNCLVAPDLSAKLGDYGTGVEKYPGDYYVVGDRALPIRWSAPESLDCTDTTIETRAITPRANLWSYAVLLWEMAAWGERPYDDLGDEQVIEMIFSLKSGFFARETSDALLKRLRDEFDAPKAFREAVEASWKFLPEDRASLRESKEILRGKRIEDFEKRWENLKPNGVNSARERDNRSASLQDLRGSVDSELWPNLGDEKKPLQAEFRLGPDEPVKNLPMSSSCLQESGSETEEESWRGRVERGAYTEKVKQKSKSVADLMVLVHIDSDSEAEISLGPQTTEKSQKKRLPASGSDGDLRSHVLADEFDEAIRKLREPSICNGATQKPAKNHCEIARIVENIEKPKLLTLTHQGQTPILRLCLGSPENSAADVKNAGDQSAATETCKTAFSASSGDGRAEKSTPEKSERNNSTGGNFSVEKARLEGPVLRLVSKGDPELPLLRYIPERAHEETEKIAEPRFDSFLVFRTPDSSEPRNSHEFRNKQAQDDSVDVEMWNDALARELEKKNLGFEAHATIFDESIDHVGESPKRSASAPNTPKSVNFKPEIGGSSSAAAKIVGDVDRQENMPDKNRASSSTPNIAKSVNFSPTESLDEDFAYSAPETPFRSDLQRKIDDGSENVNYYENLSLSSSSAPETPGKRYFEPVDEAGSKEGNFYQDLPLGTSSAPETPQKHFFEPQVEERSCKEDSLGSTSAPETPQFRGSYATRHLDEDSSNCEDLETSPRLRGSAPDTPQSRGDYSVGNCDEDSSTGEDLETGLRLIERSPREVDDEEDRKHLSTPDDERSSDSGFRDKESCEEEESPIPCPATSSIVLSGGILGSGNPTNSPLSASAEEEQMRILFELDTILDAEYYGSFRDSEADPGDENLREIDVLPAKNRSVSESLESTESTEVVATVRANSCEPDFLDCRKSAEIGSSEEGEETRGLRTDGDFSKSEGEGEKNLITGGDTEADFPPDSSDLSSKCESRGNDSSAELRRLNVDSFSDQRFDKSNESTDLSLELRSSDASEINRSRNTDSSGDSPIKSERIGNENSTKNQSTWQSPRETGNLEISGQPLKCEPENENFGLFENSAGENSEKSREKLETLGFDNSAGNSPLEDEKRNEKSETLELENSASDSPLKSEKLREKSEIFEASVEFENSAGNSSPKSEKRNETSEIFDASVEFENSASSSPLKSDKLHEKSEILEFELSASDSHPKSEEAYEKSETLEFGHFASHSPLKSEKLHDKSEKSETSAKSENSASDTPQKIEKPREKSKTSEFSNSASNFPPKSENLHEKSEKCEASAKSEKSASNSPLKIEKPRGKSETSEFSNSESNFAPKSENLHEKSEKSKVSTKSENSAGDSPLKIEKPCEKSETSEFSNSASNFPPKSENLHEKSEKSKVSTKSENSASDSPLKIEKPCEKSETSEFSNSASNFPPKSENLHEKSEKSKVSTKSENSASDSPLKIEKPREKSEISEFSNSASDSPLKSENLREKSEKSEALIKSENSGNDSPQKIEKPREKSETSEFSNSASNFATKSENLYEKSEKSEVSTKSASDSPQKIQKPREKSETSEISNPASDSPLKSEDLREKSEKSEAPLKSSNSASDSPPKSEKSEKHEASLKPENSASDSPVKSEKPTEKSETELENSSSDSPLKTDRNQTSDFSMETRGPESVHSDVEQWSSRENLNDNENDEEDSSTMSLRSDNSYVSFGLDEEFVAAIRNELREKLPRAQMPVIEALDPRDEKEPSINKDAEAKRWEDEEAEENAERGSGGVDISIRYNIYGTPLSPILEERESAGTSESLVSKDDSRDDASIASRVSALSEDVLVVDTRTNRAMMLEGNANNGEPANLQQDDDRDTSHGDFSDEENLEYPQNHLNRGMENKRMSMGSGGAPLPSPEEESKWQQQFPLPLQMQDDLMSTSFGTDRDWDSQDEDEGEEGEEGEEDEEENSSSSGEFVWKRYDESHGDLENVATRSPPNKPKSHEPEADLDEEDEGDEEDEEEEEEFTPSAWDATLAPHRSALRSPEKTLKSGDQKKSVWFKKQRYHCVYEYPKETPVAEGQGQAATTWEPTSYADWEEMMDEPRLDVYPMEYDDTNRAGDEEFYVSSSNRPFQFQSGEGKYVSQFFPGASSTLLQQQQPVAASVAAPDDNQDSQDEVDRAEAPASPQQSQTNGNSRTPDFLEAQQQQQQQQTQLGELRHTRDRLKLNLLSTSGSSKADEDSVENRGAEIEASENPQNESRKNVENPENKSRGVSENAGAEEKVFPSESLENGGKTAPETRETLEERKNNFESTEIVTGSNLAVKEEKDGKIDAKQDEKRATEAIEAKNRDLAVIRGNDEVSRPKIDSPSIHHEKASTSAFGVEQILDIPKLETEESPDGALQSRAKDGRQATIIEATRVEATSGDVQTDEKTDNFVQSSES